MAEISVAGGVDALFGLPFHLTTRCAGHQLWAANAEHLEYLEGFIAAPIRVAAITELGSKLPRWMTSAGNRQAVLAGLARLRRELPALEKR